jgi:hypothetical protein
MTLARYKDGKPHQYRILCGNVNTQGCHNCRGELGRLLLTTAGSKTRLQQ